MKRMLIIIAVSVVHALFAQEIEGLDEMHRVAFVARGPEKMDPIVSRARLKTGVELEYAEQGDAQGMPVILLHGIIDSWKSFQLVLPHLPGNLHVYALTQRGHGLSSKPNSGYTTRDFAADVAAFMEQKGIAKAIVVGHSMGGANAMQFAVDYPGKVAQLVIVSSDPYFNSNGSVSEFSQFVASIQPAGYDTFVEQFQTSTLNVTIDSSFLRTMIEEGRKMPLPTFKSAWQGLMNTDLREPIKKIRVPVMICWGERDGFCLRPGQDLMRANLPNATLKIYEGTGHSLHWEQPERFAKDLVTFIRGSEELALLECE